MARERKRERAIVLGAIALAGGLAVGCSAPVGPRASAGGTPMRVRDAGPLVFPTDRVLAFEDGVGFDARYAWFEHGRNDGEVSVRQAVPIEATRQWPVPPRPAERRVRFWYWVQR